MENRETEEVFEKETQKNSSVDSEGVEASSEAKGGKRGLFPQGIDRRSLIAGLVGGAVGMGIITLLPRGIVAVSSAASGGDGIFIEGNNANMTAKTYDMEFVQPLKLIAKKDGEIQTEGVWRSSNKHLVSVASDGTTVMRDGVGGHDVEVTWSLGDTSYSIMFYTTQTAGAHAIEVDAPMTRGAFMVRLAQYFGWPHYNAVMDDGVDIDDNGDIMETERVRNYFDVVGDNDYVKPIEATLDMGVLHAESSNDLFYPMSPMTRQDAAVILVSAFKMDNLENDYLAHFSDKDQISEECYQALNTLVGRNFMRGRTNTTLNPTDGITDTEARIIIESIDKRVVCPVWSMPISHRKFVRCRPEWMTATPDAVVKWRVKIDKYSHPELKGLFVQDRGVGAYVGTGWSDWFEYRPGFSTDPMFGLNNNKDLPYDAIWFVAEVECYAEKEGLETSPVTHFMWRIERPAWHDFAHDVLHEGGDNFPTVHRYFDNFQAAAYYIEGSERGILFDGLMPTNTTTTLIDRVNEVATKPYDFVLGHNHPDHNGAMPFAYENGLDVYVCDRTYPLDEPWKIEIYNQKYTSANPVIDTERSGMYSGDKVHVIDEGYEFDLGNCKFKVVHLPGHEDSSLLLYGADTGLLFSSDIYAVNRYWVADQFAAKGVKQDLLLSLHQQLMDIYTKDGAKVRELYTGHNRIGMGGDYLTIWEQCLQKLVNYGPDAVSHDRRGDGAIVVTDGHQYETMNWTSFSETGKQVIAEYEGQYDKKKFYRIEVDKSGKKNPLVESNLYFDYKTNAHLSNIAFQDAELVGHDFKYKMGFDEVDEKTPDGRLKFAIENKFVPYEYDYEVKTSNSEATFTPVAMSDLITNMTVNGQPASSRCPVTVKTSSPAVIEITGPDGKTKQSYTLTFVK